MSHSRIQEKVKNALYIVVSRGTKPAGPALFSVSEEDRILQKESVITQNERRYNAK
jgi:hypothetical protein